MPSSENIGIEVAEMFPMFIVSGLSKCVTDTPDESIAVIFKEIRPPVTALPLVAGEMERVSADEVAPGGTVTETSPFSPPVISMAASITVSVVSSESMV